MLKLNLILLVLKFVVSLNDLPSDNVNDLKEDVNLTEASGLIDFKSNMTIDSMTLDNERDSIELPKLFDELRQKCEKESCECMQEDYDCCEEVIEVHKHLHNSRRKYREAEENEPVVSQVLSKIKDKKKDAKSKKAKKKAKKIGNLISK